MLSRLYLLHTTTPKRLKGWFNYHINVVNKICIYTLYMLVQIYVLGVGTKNHT